TDKTAKCTYNIQKLSHNKQRPADRRVYVIGRTSCSYQYGLSFDEKPDETDTIREVAGIPIAVDQVSAPYCEGATVEWVDGPEGTGFLVRNPSMSGTCGCNGG